MALALEKLVHSGKITLMPPGGAVHHGSGAVLRLGRGTLAPGAPGDVTIFDTDAEWTYDVNSRTPRAGTLPSMAGSSAAAR